MSHAGQHESFLTTYHVSLDSAKRVGTCPGSEALRARGIATVTIPRIIQGAIWTFSIQQLNPASEECNLYSLMEQIPQHAM